jgi:beta-phosphoglucomutase-like phosphatase (HAD superfamily)
VITNAFLAEHGIGRRFDPDDLRRSALGRNFRGIAGDLAAEAGVTVDADVLEEWVARERRHVERHLASVLRPDTAVSGPLSGLGSRYRLAVVSSSATSRLAACFSAAGLEELFPEDVRFSAEDSLPAPTSKPDPAVYAFAGERLGVDGPAGLAVEDAVAGVLSAVAAGFPVVGNIQFVPAAEREQRIVALREAGANAIVHSWTGLARLLAEGDGAEAARYTAASQGD